MNILEVSGLKKTFKNQTVLDSITFSVKAEEFISILGVSGCGKTTLLRSLAGLEKIDCGCILLKGNDITHITASRRNIGLVFQGFSLFPNMTAEQNVMYPLKFKKNFRDKMGYIKLIERIMQVCEINEIRQKYPFQLSGGQQQRTAIARALVMSPDILMLDEPFSALDVSLRQRLGELLKECQNQLKMTMLYVTHDQEEAFSLSDRIAILNNGKIQQIGTPEMIYCFPENEFVNSFIHERIKEKYERLQKIVQPLSKKQEEKKNSNRDGCVCSYFSDFVTSSY